MVFGGRPYFVSEDRSLKGPFREDEENVLGTPARPVQRGLDLQKKLAKTLPKPEIVRVRRSFVDDLVLQTKKLCSPHSDFILFFFRGI